MVELSNKSNADMHKKDASNEAESLTVTNFFIK